MDLDETVNGASGRTPFEPWNEPRAREIIGKSKSCDGPMLPVLHALQAAFGYVPEEAVGLVAAELNLSRAEVFGVATFYHDFRHHLPGQHVVKLCEAEACQAMGGPRVVACAERRLGIKMGETSADGRVTLEAVYCLGLCAVSPSGMIDGNPVGRLDEARVEMLLAGLGA